MVNPRTINMLVCLIGAMTVGTFVLMMMETDPIQPSSEPLAALGTVEGCAAGDVIRPRNLPLQQAKWRNIVVHTTGAEGDAIARQCHFLIAPGRDGKPRIQATTLWHDQMSANHVRAADETFNADSIGVCLSGDYSRRAPSRSQFQALVMLIQDLQRACSIRRANVYLLSDLDSRIDSPGRAFPSDELTTHLLRISQ
ncbi:MAG: peptidoglycan recognition protein family protein [Planctomycetota bacterium]|jgi:hypothetical protein